jgi:hypothetical protein
MGAFERLVSRLNRAGVRFVVIGLSGANYYVRDADALFVTQDRDLLLPADATAVLASWRACEGLGLELSCAGEPLDQPRDSLLAERVVANRALVSATDRAGLRVDFALVMTGFDFETVWGERRVFRIGRTQVPVARLAHIVESKRRAGRDKDRLFLATHAEALRDIAREGDAERAEPGARREPRSSGKRGVRARRRPSRQL